MADLYKVYLADLEGCVPLSLKIDINIRLQSYFEQVAQSASPAFAGALVHWIAYFPVPADHEILIYFVSSRSRALVHTAFNFPVPTTMGSTWPSTNGTLSEVYMVSSVHKNDAIFLANLAFHEAMHNKLQLDDAGLHGKNGLAAGSVYHSTQLTGDNVNDMAAALRNAVPQWATGVSKIVRGRYDPASPYFQP